jgi:hypothetical protein
MAADNKTIGRFTFGYHQHKRCSLKWTFDIDANDHQSFCNW